MDLSSIIEDDVEMHLQEKLTGVEQKLSSANLTVAEQAATIKDLNKRIAAFVSSNSTKEKQVQGLSTEIEDLKRQLEAVNKSLTEKDAPLANLEKAKPGNDNTMADNLAQTEGLRQQIGELEEKVTILTRIKVEAVGLYAAVLLQQHSLKSLTEIAGYVARWGVGMNVYRIGAELTLVKDRLMEVSRLPWLNFVTDRFPFTNLGTFFNYAEVVETVCQMHVEGKLEEINEEHSDIAHHPLLAEIYERLVARSGPSDGGDLEAWLRTFGDKQPQGKEDSKWLVSTGEDVKSVFDNVGSFHDKTGEVISVDGKARWALHQPLPSSHSTSSKASGPPWNLQPLSSAQQGGITSNYPVTVPQNDPSRVQQNQAAKFGLSSSGVVPVDTKDRMRSSKPPFTAPPTRTESDRVLSPPANPTNPTATLLDTTSNVPHTPDVMVSSKRKLIDFGDLSQHTVKRLNVAQTPAAVFEQGVANHRASSDSPVLSRRDRGSINGSRGTHALKMERVPEPGRLTSPLRDSPPVSHSRLPDRRPSGIAPVPGLIAAARVERGSQLGSPRAAFKPTRSGTVSPSIVDNKPVSSTPTSVAPTQLVSSLYQSGGRTSPSLRDAQSGPASPAPTRSSSMLATSAPPHETDLDKDLIDFSFTLPLATTPTRYDTETPKPEANIQTPKEIKGATDSDEPASNKGPRTQEKKGPRTQEKKGPRTQEKKGPRTQEKKGPRTQEKKGPRTQEKKGPRTQEKKAMQIKKNQTYKSTTAPAPTTIPEENKSLRSPSKSSSPEIDPRELRAKEAAQAAMNAAMIYFAKNDRAQAFLSTQKILQVKAATLKVRQEHLYVLYKNMGQALHVYDTEYAKEHPESYSFNGPISEAILGRWLPNLRPMKVLKFPSSYLLDTIIFPSKLTDKDLEQYSIEGVPEYPEFILSDYPNPERRRRADDIDEHSK